jgi:hypothetical protein
MNTCRRAVIVNSCVTWLLLVGTASVGWAQQTGTLAGTVRDAQGAVLPGAAITLTSAALIGNTRTTVSSASGGYQVSALPPGTYEVGFDLTGFTLVKRNAVVEVNRTTRLDVEMGVGAIQETVTVSGASPVVDVSSTVTQTNITKDLYEAVPTGRNPWVMAGLVPGVITGRLDVGGTEGMQQYNLEAFGSADSQKSFSIDGLKTNWPGGGGGATMQYYGFEMYEEFNMQTASGTAESDVSGVYMNMVTKSGGNRVSSDHNIYFMNDSLQGGNLDDALRARLGLQPGQQSGAAGNPIKISYDWSSTLGGPIKRDRAWGFAAMRWWRLDQLQIGALNPDGSQAIDDNRIRNFMGKVTWQTNQQLRTSLMFNRNLKDRFHRREVPFSEDKATVLQDQPAQNYVAQLNYVWGRATVVDARVGRMWGTFPTRYQKEVQPTDIALRDVIRNTQVNAASGQSLNPNHRYQANGNVSYFVPSALGGSHDIKGGIQLSWEKMQYERIRNGDILLEMRDGVPFRAQIANTPIDSDHRLRTWGAFVQDRWGLGKATINVGFRMDGLNGSLPAQSSAPGTYVGARDFSKTDIYDYPFNIAPRLGFSYDLRGNGQTAIKAYYGRFYNQFGSDVLESSNPNALATQQVTWTDGNGNLRLDPGELGPLPVFARGLFPRVQTNTSRPYSDEFNAGVEHQLVTNLAVGVSYHRRHHRDGLGVLDIARPASAYTPETRTYTDSDGQVKSITLYKLQPAFGLLNDRVIDNVPGLESTYNGVQFDLQKKLSNRWQMLTGLSLQKHEGFEHGGTFTNLELNNPNARINRDNGSVFIDLPWTYTLAGSYMLPWQDISVSGKYTARAGDPLNRTQVFTFTAPTVSQVSETVRVVQRGTDRTETVTQFLDIRFAKRVRLGATSFEGTLDVFNLLNANHVLDQNIGLGSTFGRPSRVLTPRIVRFGLTARF